MVSERKGSIAEAEAEPAIMLHPSLRRSEPLSMPQPSAKVVVFDIGNVLLHWDPRLLYRPMFADNAQMEWFLTEVCSPRFNRELDLGRPFGDAIADLTARFPDYAREILAYDERWLETTQGPIAESVAILEALRRNRVPNYAITNFSAEKFAVARSSFGFLDRFDGIVVSGEEGLLKPDPGIYRLLLNRYGLAAADCLFIDDVPENLEGARAVGMQAYLFEGAAAMRAELSRHGLLR
jgi:FMN phosphatase YigB (HAD superfamily)